MTIDIIAFTDKQLSCLSTEQVLEVKDAQRRKNDLTLECEERLQQEKHRLVRNGIFHSGRYALLEEKIRAEYQSKINLIRDGLLFYLRYTMRIEINFDDDFEPPYEVDYALSYEERLSVVKSYYEETYTNAQERFDEFRKDTVAPQYLGELYMPLYDYFLSYSKV